jgi:hypothetical protein
MNIGKLIRPQVSANSCKSVIFIAIVYVIRITQAATAVSQSSLEDLSGEIREKARVGRSGDLLKV